MHVTHPDDIAAYLHAHWGEDFPGVCWKVLPLKPTGTAYR